MPLRAPPLTSPPFDRRAGLLLHPTSLPSPYGAGDIGPGARDWLAWCEAAGVGIWQVLPLNPIDGYGCPYASPSAFAREPLLLSLDDLETDGWLTHGEKAYLGGDPWRVDWRAVQEARAKPLATAAARIAATVDLSSFELPNPWVTDWALYAAMRATFNDAWGGWPDALRQRDPDALAQFRDQHAAQVQHHIALQWVFDQQWTRLRVEAHRRGVQLWGDVPFFVSGDSADVWSHRDLFRVGDYGEPEAVTGVPPDAFSPTGQRWGHPHFNEAAHAAQAYAWWRARAQATLKLVDVLRLDHFRGLAGVWEIPTADATAENGRWIAGPGAPLLDALRDQLGGLPFVAEDLGVITPDVRALRDDYGMPGMAILQFAFGNGQANDYLPHHHRANQVVYTGTHDNDTVLGWYRSASPSEQDWARRYLAVHPADVTWGVIRAALRSVANTAIVPMQDILVLGSEGRMNVPGVEHGNWAWRLGREALNLPLARKLREQLLLSDRIR